MAGQHTRRTHIYFLWSEGIWGRWFGGLWLLYGILAAIKTEVLTPEQQEKWQVIKMAEPLLSIPIAWWIAGSCMLIVAWIFEASFRLQTKNIASLDSLRNDIAIAKGSRAVLQVGEPQAHLYQQTQNYRWTIPVTNLGSASAISAQMSLCNINPRPKDTLWPAHYPFPLTRSGLTLDSPINPINSQDTQSFDLFFTCPDINNSGNFLIQLDPNSILHNQASIEIGERWELTYKITATNSDPVVFSLVLHIESGTLSVKQKT